MNNIRQYERQALNILRKNRKLRSLNESLRAHSLYRSYSWFKYSPEYFDTVRYAERLIREQEQQGKHLSYGQKQAEIFLLLYRAEQEYKQKHERLYKY